MKTLASSIALFFLLSFFWVPAGETGSKSIAITPSGEYGVEGGTNVFYRQMDAGTEGADNTFYGQGAGASITSGKYNTFVGYHAGNLNTTGGCNTIIGDVAGATTTTGENNTFLGYGAGRWNNTGTHNTFLGFFAGTFNTTGIDNTFLGGGAGLNNTTGASNTFLGARAGQFNTIGTYNIFLGDHAGYSNTTGAYNTFNGFHAGYSNTMGYNNTYIGDYAGAYNSTGIGNTFIGNEVGAWELGTNKLYIDNSSTSDPLIYGEFDNNIVNINGKLGIGTKTPGYPVEVSRTGANASIVLNRTDGAKNYVNATASFGNFGTVNNFPLRLTVNSAARMILHTDSSLSMASGANCTAGGVWTNASSIALKENISTLNSDEATTTLQALNPVKYNYKAEKDESHVGFIAEEVPDMVAMKDRKSLSPMDIVAVLTKVTQDQQKTIENLTQKMQDQQQIIEKIKMEFAELKMKRLE